MLRLGRDAQGSAVRFNDERHIEEDQPHAGGLRGEEWIEDPIQIRRGHARPESSTAIST